MDLKVYREHTKVTRRFKEAELVLKNAKIINVFTNEIITGDIAIEDGMIVGIGNYEGKQEHDMTGKYVCPGFIDSHLHLESTLVTPKELVTVASRHERQHLLLILMNLQMYQDWPVSIIFWIRRRMQVQMFL